MEFLGMKAIVVVTEELLKRGMKASATLCPIALALKEVFPNSLVSVGLSTATLYNKETLMEELEFTLDDNAFRFISKFDMGAPVRPGQYTMIEQWRRGSSPRRF